MLRWPLVLPLLFLARGAHADVVVDSRTRCLDTSSLQERLTSVLEKAAGPTGTDLLVSVLGSPGNGPDTRATLRAVDRHGDVVLDRSFSLEPADCPSGPELLATVLESFLRELPVERWVVPTPVPVSTPTPVPTPEAVASPVVAPRIASRGDFSIVAGAGSQFVSRAEGLVGVRHELGDGADLLGTGAFVRVAAPQRLGVGRFQESFVLASAGWTHRAGAWTSRLDARAGMLILSGTGYVRDSREWLPWVEVSGGVEFRAGPLTLGPAVAVTPFSYFASVQDPRQTRALAPARALLLVSLPLSRKK